MRILPNETARLRQAATPPSRKREAGIEHEPERRCILSGEHEHKDGLIRLAMGPDGSVAPDIRARAPGRGAWIGVDRPTLEAAQTKGKLRGALLRAFKVKAVTIPDDLPARIEAALARTTMDRLGLEARAGSLMFGAEKIEQAARSGQVHALLHAADARPDGNAKLDQAWRVGEEQEGSALKGLVLSVDRPILSAAIGRENIVHIALTDKAAAARVMMLINRWHGFIGHETATWPCANTRQGSSALNIEE